jgi:predicted RNA-binding protein with PIN domain
MEEITAAQTWNELAGDAALERTVQALQANGITPVVAATKDEARQRVLELVPEGAQVFTAQSATLNEIGVAAEINESGRYDSLRKKLMTLDRMTQRAEMRRLTAAPDYVMGSVNAITENGHLISASFGGSQLARMRPARAR